MKLTIGKGIQAKAGLEFVKAFLKEHNTEALQWVRFDFGSIRNSAEGRCLPPDGNLGYRIACQFPKVFPRSIRISRHPIYRMDNGDWPCGKLKDNVTVQMDEKTGKQWVRQYDIKVLEDQDETAVWTFFNAAYHWIKDTGQADWDVKGRSNKIEADAYAEKMLKRFHKECKVHA